MGSIYDLVVRGGVIVDGTGAESFSGDVAVRDGVIVAVGQVDGRGDEEIDASGLIVTPGFVDVHTHYDGQVTWEHRLAPSSSHGVTTVVMGNCGVGFAPVRGGDHELMIKLMEGVEDIPDVVMAEGVPFNWSSFPEYLDALEKRFCDVDFATQIPHSPLRVFVMGERGARLEPPTESDLKAMRACVREAVEAGALGVSTSRNLFHRFRSGALSPCVATPVDELLALSEGLRDAGAGVFQCNPNIDTDADADAEMRVFETVARHSGRPVNFSLIFTPQRPDHWSLYVARTRAARAGGLGINAQFLPRPMGVLHGLDLSYHLFCLNPSYRAIAALPLDQKVARMRDPDLRARLLAEEPDDPNPAFVGLIKAPLSLYEMDDPADYDFDPEDSLQARAAREGRPFKEVVYDSLLKHDGHMILCAYGGDVPPHLERTAGMIGEDNMIVALGDGGAHYAMICDAAYPTYMLANRLGRRGLDLPTTIRALTSQPAASLGLCDRGLLATGYKADLNIIDPDKMLLRRPRVACDLPAGGKRLHQSSEGYAATIVSGVMTYRNGEPTGALPGRLVRGARPAPQQPKPVEMAAI